MPLRDWLCESPSFQSKKNRAENEQSACFHCLKDMGSCGRRNVAVLFQHGGAWGFKRRGPGRTYVSLCVCVCRIGITPERLYTHYFFSVVFTFLFVASVVACKPRLRYGKKQPPPPLHREKNQNQNPATHSICAAAIASAAPAAPVLAAAPIPNKLFASYSLFVISARSLTTHASGRINNSFTHHC